MKKESNAKKVGPRGLQPGLPGMFDLEIPGRIFGSQEGPETRDLSANQRRQERQGEKLVPSFAIQVSLDGSIHFSEVFDVDDNSNIWPKLSNKRFAGKVPLTTSVTMVTPEIWTFFLRMVSGISKAWSPPFAYFDYAQGNRDKKENVSGILDKGARS